MQDLIKGIHYNVLVQFLASATKTVIDYRDELSRNPMHGVFVDNVVHYFSGHVTLRDLIRFTIGCYPSWKTHDLSVPVRGYAENYIMASPELIQETVEETTLRVIHRLTDVLVDAKVSSHPDYANRSLLRGLDKWRKIRGEARAETTRLFREMLTKMIVSAYWKPLVEEIEAFCHHRKTTLADAQEDWEDALFM